MTQRKSWPELDELPQYEEEELVAEPLKYSVWSLLVATSLIAVAIALLNSIHVFGLLILFVACVGIELVLRKIEHPSRLQISRGLWGVVMPVLCVVYDPGFLHQNWYNFANWTSSEFVEQILDDRRGSLFLPPILLQSFVLAAWLPLGIRLRPSPFLSGFFWFGACLAFFIGFCLTPISVVGLIAIGMGLLGLTPYWTGFTFAGVAKQVDAPSEFEATAGQRWLKFAGFCTAIVAPILISIALCVLRGGTVAETFQIEANGW